MATEVFDKILSVIYDGLRWADDANCRNMELDLFFPPVGINISPFVKEVCDTCDVRERCLWYANETSSEYGIFGGMTPNQRRDWRRRNNVRLGMSYKDWRDSQRDGLLRVVPDDWRDDEQTV
jgi:WhiB family redox-sensing transcriptional regulator